MSRSFVVEELLDAWTEEPDLAFVVLLILWLHPLWICRIFFDLAVDRDGRRLLGLRPYGVCREFRVDLEDFAITEILSPVGNVSMTKNINYIVKGSVFENV